MKARLRPQNSAYRAEKIYVCAAPSVLGRAENASAIPAADRRVVAIIRLLLEKAPRIFAKCLDFFLLQDF